MGTNMSVIKCKNKDCKSEYQDKKYGVGNRIANVTKKNELRCTVCGNTNK